MQYMLAMFIFIFKLITSDYYIQLLHPTTTSDCYIRLLYLTTKSDYLYTIPVIMEWKLRRGWESPNSRISSSVIVKSMNGGSWKNVSRTSVMSTFVRGP